MISHNIQFEQIDLAVEKPDILTGLLLNNLGTIIGDSKMKYIPLTQGKFACVDDADYEWLNQYKWHAQKDGNTWYAVRHITKPDGKRQAVMMHRFILGLKPSELTDHRNHNGLHNWQDNLRICNHSQNKQNSNPQKNGSSKYKGVYWKKSIHKWGTQIMKKGKNYHLGYFTSEIEAAKAYDIAAVKYFGEFASINFEPYF